MLAGVVVAPPPYSPLTPGADATRGAHRCRRVLAVVGDEAEGRAEPAHQGERGRLARGVGVLFDQRAEQMRQGRSARMDVENDVVAGNSSLLEKMREPKRRRPFRVAGKRAIEIAAVERRAPATARTADAFATGKTVTRPRMRDGSRRE